MGFDPYSTVLKLVKIKKVSLDNNAFKLHYRCTVIMLLTCTIVVTSKQFFGEPIRCIGDSSKFNDAINNFCWIYGTHSATRNYQGKLGKHMPHYGVGPNVRGEGEVYHMYYQWVCFLLPLQAILFYMPHALWKKWEGGRVACLTAQLDSATTPTSWDEKRRDDLVKYLLNISRYTRNMYAYQYAFCELLNLLNIMLQVFIVDTFMGGMFTNYGVMVATFIHNSTSEIVNPMEVVFPKVTKCIFEYYGSSGGIQTLDLLCILPLNIFHEKIFAVMWFWFIFLGIVSIITLFYRMFTFMCPCLRAYSIMVQAKVVPKYHIFAIVNKFSISDWYLLNLVGKNMNPFIYKEILIQLGEEIEKVKKVEYV